MQYYGAKWWKFDFHVHTPVSMDYGKGINQTELKGISPRDWLLKVMEKEIDCIAITDHNSGDWIDELKQEYVIMQQENIEGFRELVIFPGVEITVHGNIHLLAMFDPLKSSRDISNLLSRCEYQGTYGDSDGCTKKSFNEVVEVIHDLKGLAIPAHVDDYKGLFKEQEGTTLKTCLQANGLLAIQVCNQDYLKPQIYIDSKLDLAEVAGSDSHHPETLGKSFSWVKMETPNLEALRLALHDGEDSVIRFDTISRNPNETNNRFFIESIEITNGSKAGRGRNPLKVNFSPWLNTVIGGRGSGKSSLIEYMRLPFNKVSGLPERIEAEFQEFCKIPKERGKAGMLTNETKIRVEMYKDGRKIALTWANNEIFEQHLNGEGEWEDREASSNIDSRFPLRIFSQKQLYALTEDPEYILNIIDQQLDKSIWLENKNILLKNWMNIRAELRGLNERIKTKGNLENELNDIKAKMKIYEELGHKALLDEYQKIKAVDKKFLDCIEIVDEFCDNVLVPTSKFKYSGNLIQLFNSSEFEDFDEESLAILEKQNEGFRQLVFEYNALVEKITAFKKNLNLEIDGIPWRNNKVDKENQYLNFVYQLEAAGEKNPYAYSEFVSRQQELESKLLEIQNLEFTVNQLKVEEENIYEKICLHEKSLREDRMKIINEWVGENSHIKMYLKPMGNYSDAELNFRNLIRKPNNEFAKDILEKDDDGKHKKGIIFELIESEDPWRSRENILTKLKEATIDEQQGFGKLFIKHWTALKENTPEDFDRIFAWFPEDKIILKIVNSNRKEEDIETGSAAMLSLLLLLDDTPIIIDQPEEDLDTKRISDLVVTGLRDFKKKQQVIVITHNPNIPVNASAENIIHMNFAAGQINHLVSGALQKKEVRESVCEIMEGGKSALEKRYYRISKTLDQ